MVVEELKLKNPKTGEMAAALNKLVGEDSALILVGEKNDDEVLVMRSTKNLANAKTLSAKYLNIRDLLGYDKVILPVSAIEVISGYLGK